MLYKANGAECKYVQFLTQTSNGLLIKLHEESLNSSGHVVHFLWCKILAISETVTPKFEVNSSAASNSNSSSQSPQHEVHPPFPTPKSPLILRLPRRKKPVNNTVESFSLFIPLPSCLPPLPTQTRRHLRAPLDLSPPRPPHHSPPSSTSRPPRLHHLHSPTPC